MSTYSCLHVHVVFATRNRAPWITNPYALHRYMDGILRNLEAQPLAIGGIEDHVHLLFGYRPSHRLSDMVREVKKASGVWAREYMFEKATWQEGYGAFGVDREGLAPVVSYIATQAEHHRRVSSRDEYIELCRLNGIEVDPRYLD